MLFTVLHAPYTEGCQQSTFLARHCVWCSSYRELLISILVVCILYLSVLVENIDLRKLDGLEFHLKMDQFSHILACWDDSLSLWLYFYLMTICWCWVPLLVGVLCKVFFCFAELCVFSSFEIVALQRRESWLLYFYCFLNVNSLSLFFASSSQYYGLVCSVWSWYFLLILTHLLFWHIQNTTVESHLTNHFISIRTIQSVLY